MLSSRKKFAQKVCLTASLLLATSGVVAVLQSAAPASPVPAAAAPATVARQALRPISIVPGVVGPGAKPQNANTTKWAVTTKYGAAKAGKTVKLQRQSGASWVVVAKSKIDKRGYALFAVASPSRTSPVTYRIYGPGGATASASTSLWGSDEDWTEQFSGTALNSAYWSHRQTDYEPLSRRTCAKASPRAVKVSQGTAKLSVIIDKSRSGYCKPPKVSNPAKIYGKFRWRLQANIGTDDKHSFLYGVAAARIKFQPLQGQHASFWLQPDDPDTSRTTGHEIDAIEWFGKGVPNGGLTSFAYAPSRLGKKYGIGNKGWVPNPDQFLMNQTDEWYKRYHVFSVEWSPLAYIFRIDGKETGRIPASKITGNGALGTASTPEYPILSILCSDYELAKLPDPEEKHLPQTMSVDWVKTWQNPAFITPDPPVTAAP